MAEKQDAKRKKLEEFRSLRTSKRKKKKKQISDEREKVRTQNCFVCDNNSYEKQSNQVLIETERKHLVEFRNVKEIVAFINLHFDFS